MKTLIITIAIAMTAGVLPQAMASKPNIVVVLGDDASWSTFGCMENHLAAHTPNIDGLAAQGMRFDRFYCAVTMCAPVRHELYTALHPATSGVYDNACRPKANYGNVVDWLGGLGYNVGLSGKLHFNSPTKFEVIPGYPEHANDEHYTWSTDGVEAFMKRSMQEQKPFCAFICSTYSHAPWTDGDPARFPLDKIRIPPHMPDTPATRKAIAAQAAEVAVLDRQVGEVLGLIKKLDVEKETLVVFLSEHGTEMPKGKYSLYNYGARALAIFRWPGRIQPGTTTGAVAMYADVVPTLVEAGGGTAPAGIDGSSFLKVLRGTTGEHRKYAYTTCFAHYQRAIVGERFKLIRRDRDFGKYTLPMITDPQCERLHALAWQEWNMLATSDAKIHGQLERIKHPPEWELHDLQKDPFELVNLAENPEYSAVLEAMKRDLEKEMQVYGDSYDAYVPKNKRPHFKNRRKKKKS